MGEHTSGPDAWAVPPPDAELRRLEPLIGTWRSKDHSLDSAAGPGVPVTNKETFYWLDGGYFLVSTYETSFGDEPTQTGINYWGYDSESRNFRIIFFSNNGPFTEEGNRYEGVVAEGKLTFEGPARFQYKLDANGRVKINADGTLTVPWWIRDESGVWKPWMTNTLRKVSTAVAVDRREDSRSL